MYITNFTPEQLVYERRWRIWIVLIVDAIELFACFRRPETLAQTLFVIGAVYVNLHILFNYGYATREYIADTEGITAIWFKKLRKSYSWSEFEIVQSYTVRTYSGPEKWILCSRIPVKEIFEGETTSYWVQGRPFQVLYMFKMPDEKEREFFSYLPQKFTQPDTGTKGE